MVTWDDDNLQRLAELLTGPAHTRDCALQCAQSGFGIVTKDQKFLKFDEAGNQKDLAELRALNKKDRLRVNGSGEVQGDPLMVSSVSLR